MRQRAAITFCFSILTAIWLAGLLQGCGTDEHTAGKWPIVNMDELPDTVFDCRSLVRKVHIIPLAGEPLLGKVDKVIERDSLYYILDKVGVQVLAFDTKGRFVRRFGKLGEGPGEFKDVYDMSIPSRSDQVVVLKAWKLTFFDSLGHFLREVPLEIPPACLGNGERPDILCYTTSFDDPEFFVHCINSQGKIISKHLPSSRDQSPNVGLSRISGIMINGPGNHLYTNYPSSSTVYTFRQGKFEPMIQFVGDRFWPETRREDIEYFVSRLYAMDDFGYLHKYQIADDYGIFTIIRDLRLQNLIYFFDSEKVYGKSNFTDNALCHLLATFTASGYTEDGGIIFVLDEERKMELENRYGEDLSPLVPDLIPSTLWRTLSEADGNPILMTVYLEG